MARIKWDQYDTATPITQPKQIAQVGGRVNWDQQNNEGFLSKLKRGISETGFSFKAGLQQTQAGLAASGKNIFERLVEEPLSQEGKTNFQDKESQKAQRLSNLFGKIGITPLKEHFEKQATKYIR